MKTDLEYLEECITIAKSNIDPIGNKGIGCVLIGRSGNVYTGNRYTFINHQGKEHKTIHAEQFVLWEAGEDARDGKLYVTMEPCMKRWHNSVNFHYKSCAELIVESGIKTVIIGTYDNDFGEGGKKYLEDNGIEVVLVETNSDIKEINKGQRVEDIVKDEYEEFIRTAKEDSSSDSSAG